MRTIITNCNFWLITDIYSSNSQNLNDIAENVQKTKDSHRQATLQQALQSVDTNLKESETSLPLSLTLRVAGVHIHSCSYFSSNALPLKINFLAPDRSIVPAIYKVSDDLQQDMLTLQMVRIMDKLWLNHGLDLKMVSFICIPTGKKKGEYSSIWFLFHHCKLLIF